MADPVHNIKNQHNVWYWEESAESAERGRGKKAVHFSSWEHFVQERILCFVVSWKRNKLHISFVNLSRRKGQIVWIRYNVIYEKEQACFADVQKV